MNFTVIMQAFPTSDNPFDTKVDAHYSDELYTEEDPYFNKFDGVPPTYVGLLISYYKYMPEDQIRLLDMTNSLSHGRRGLLLESERYKITRKVPVHVVGQETAPEKHYDSNLPPPPPPHTTVGFLPVTPLVLGSDWTGKRINGIVPNGLHLHPPDADNEWAGNAPPGGWDKYFQESWMPPANAFPTKLDEDLAKLEMIIMVGYLPWNFNGLLWHPDLKPPPPHAKMTPREKMDAADKARIQKANLIKGTVYDDPILNPPDPSTQNNGAGPVPPFPQINAYDFVQDLTGTIKKLFNWTVDVLKWEMIYLGDSASVDITGMTIPELIGDIELAAELTVLVVASVIVLWFVKMIKEILH